MAIAEDEYLTDDLDAAEADLGHGLSEGARLGLHYARIRAEGYRIPNERYRSHNGNGPRLTATGRALEVARKELSGRVLQHMPRSETPCATRRSLGGTAAPVERLRPL